MVKRITALATALIMLLSVTITGAEFSDVAPDTEKSEAIDVLSELGVLSGMGDGSFAPYENLTRAQFAKIAVCIMGKTNEAVVTTDAFSDVKSTDWYSGYVKVVAENGIITGYPDGSFGAEEAITYAQAITVVIRLLGYDATDVGHKWPQGYLDKAKVLSLTEGMNFTANDYINRETAALLIYRALFTDVKNKDAKLVTQMDVSVYEDTVVMATNKQNSSLLANQVQTNNGVFKTLIPFDEHMGSMGTLVTNKEGETVAFVPSGELKKEEYVLLGIYTSEDNVFIMDKSGLSVPLDKNLTVYMGGNETTSASLESGINQGSTVTLVRENNILKYAFVDEYKNEGPRVVYSTKTVMDLFEIKDKNSLKVIRKGIMADIEDIALYDVLYYSEKANTIYAYNDRVTGLYEEAYPMKSNVSKITLSGNTYSLSTLDAVNKLNESEGAFKIGDRVTLLLGEDSTVVAAVNLTGTDVSCYGVITDSGTEISTEKGKEGKTEYFVNMTLSNGESVKYITKDDSYFDKAGQLCEIDFENGYLSLSFLSESKLSGTVNKDALTIGSYKMSQDCVILELTDKDNSNAVVKKLSPAELHMVTLNRSDVRNVVFDKTGKIALLYVSNVSGSGYIYGILTQVPDNDAMIKSYKVLSDNKEYTVAGITNYYAQKGDAVGYLRGIDGDRLKMLLNVASGTNVKNWTDNVIEIGGKNIVTADDVTIYAGRTISEIKTISAEDAKALTGIVNCYADKPVNEGGKVRVIRIITA